MYLIENLIPKHDYPSNLHDMKLWETDAEHLSSAHLHGFHYRAKRLIDPDMAKELVLRVADAVNLAHEAGQISNDKFKNFQLYTPPMLSGEFRIALEALPMRKRQCIYFALLAEMPLENAIDLTWDDAKLLFEKGILNDAALDVIEAIPPRLRCPYVFWNDETRMPYRLVDLRADTEILFGCEFEALQDRFNKMLLVDLSEGVEDLKTIIKECN